MVDLEEIDPPPVVGMVLDEESVVYVIVVVLSVIFCFSCSNVNTQKIYCVR